MISRLAHRLGFAPSIPLALVDEWIVPRTAPRLVALAPRGGEATCLVDEFGRLQPGDASWTLDWTVAGGARFVAAATADRIVRRLVAPAVVETILETPAGRVLHRVAAAVVDGRPVAVVEIENAGGVAVAVGLVVRPLRHDGRGYVDRVAVDASGIAVDGMVAVRFGAAPAAARTCTGADGDLLQAIPEPAGALLGSDARCRSGGAQAAAVWPLPHTATLRMVVELTSWSGTGNGTGRDERPRRKSRQPVEASLGAAQPVRSAVPAPKMVVPTTTEINNGWRAHLDRGLRIDVDGLDIADHLAVAARTLLSLWPRPADAASAITALAELGFSRDVPRLFAVLERSEDDAATVRCLARLAELGEGSEVSDHLESILGPLARAAHGVAAAGGQLARAPWIDSAVSALADRLLGIGQPDVAARIAAFAGRGVSDDPFERFAALSASPDAPLGWPGAQCRSAADLVVAARSLVIADAGSEIRLLPHMPQAWRGRSVEVFNAPIAGGSVSFGLRWHGPRPALFWQIDRATDDAVTIAMPEIDPAFSTQEPKGELLLADPGWPRV